MFYHTRLMPFFDNDQDSGVIDVDKMTDEEIDNLGIEEAGNMEISDDGKAIKKGTTETKEPKVEPEENEPEEKAEDKKEPDEKKEPEEKEELTIDDQIKAIDDIPKEKRTPEQTAEHRRLHAEKRMHEATQEAAELKRKNAELEEKLYKTELDKEEVFERLSLEDEKELEETDPDEYKKYSDEKQAYETRTQQRAAETSKNQFINIAAFYKAKTGVDLNVEELLTLESTADGKHQLKDTGFRDFLASDEFKKIDEELKYMKPSFNGTFTVDQMNKADLLVNKDKYLSDAQLKGREQATDDITKAANSDASKFSGIPASDGTKGLKRISELTEEEIDNMSQTEIESYEEELKAAGMA